MKRHILDLGERTLNRERARSDRANTDAGLEDIIPQTQSHKIGTLSFPVRDKNPINNTRRIEEIIRRRQPTLLLCAGWSVPTIEDLEPIVALTKHVKTMVVLETRESRASFRIFGGEKFPMGKQFFRNGNEATAANLCSLEKALPDRSFTFSDRKALLLVCGEVMIVEKHAGLGRFRDLVPEKVKRSVIQSAIILNPTHTRMGRQANLIVWRKFLSGDHRFYVSASNWNLPNQHPSRTLHTFWHNGREQRFLNNFENDFLCYREWDPSG